MSSTASNNLRAQGDRRTHPMADAETDPVGQLDAPGGLFVDREVVDAAVVVRAHGDLDMATAELLDQQLRAAEAVVAPPAPVVLDLTGVQFLASTGLALLVTHHELCAEHGTPLRIVASHRQVLRPIQITGLQQKLVIVDTVADALAG
jgi:anti-sigma B factor antagonist